MSTLLSIFLGRRRLLFLAVYALYFVSVGTVFADISEGSLSAFYLQQIPTGYAAQDKTISSLHDAGAKAVIFDLPLGKNGLPDYRTLPNIVYLIHKAGLKAIVIVPVRNLPGLVALHEEWEDIRYDLADESSGRSGMLDLFNTNVVFALSELVRKIATFSVDGIFLGHDFALGPGDGMSETALERARKRLGEGVSVRKLFHRSGGGHEGMIGDQFGTLFWKWQAVKRDRLLQVYDALVKSARRVNSSIVFGIPVPVVLPVSTDREVLAQYAYEMGLFIERNVNYYWTIIPYSELRESQNLGYRQSMKIVARTALSASTAVRNSGRLVMILEVASQDGRILPLSEIEEATALVRHAGDMGLAYGILANSIVEKDFMQKMFRRP